MEKRFSFQIAFALLATISAMGCGKGDDSPSVTIGQAYQGGIVIHVDGTGKHGLIATTSDQGKVSWQCSNSQACNTLINGANGIAIGTGAQNTLDIVSGYTGNQTAASLCNDLVFGGYDDWFLPSEDELYLVWQQRAVVGISDGTYWSSSQYNYIGARAIDFYDGSKDPTSKEEEHYVRAVRAF